MLPLSASCYLAKQGVGLLSLQRRAQPVERVLEQTEDAATVQFLARAAAIRRFGVDSLGLVDNRNFTTYVRTDSTYVVAVVSAARPDTFEQHRWCYPIVGCVPYKGFFDARDAEKEKEKLRAQGYETYDWHASAFSTMGILTDPLLSYMEAYSTYELASLLLHEQTHALIYLKGQTQFNEELATFVGHEGALRFVALVHGDSSDEYRHAAVRREEGARYRGVVRELYEQLDSLYRLPLSREQTLLAKRTIIETQQSRFLDSYDSLFTTNRYRRFGTMEITNAYVMMRATYGRDLELYYRVLEQQGGDLRRTIAALAGARQHRDDPKGYVREVVLGEAKSQSVKEPK